MWYSVGDTLNIYIAIAIAIWQRTNYRVDLQQTENIDPTARFH